MGIPVAAAEVDVTLFLDLGEAVWQLEPAVMNFVAITGGDNPPSQGLLVKTLVDYPFNWIVEDGSAITDDAAWLPINVGAGTAPGVFYVAPDITGLAPGTYSTELAVHSPGDDNYALATVNLTVNEAGLPQPLMQIFPTTLLFEATIGQGQPGSQSFGITNIGNGQLNWSALSDVTWLGLDLTDGNGDATVNVSVTTDGLSPGTHVGQITVTDAAGNQSVVRAVLQLRESPTMVIDGSYLVFSGLSSQAGPLPQSFNVRNRGVGSFDWEASETSAWLQITPGQGTAPTAVEVRADTTGLAPGAFQGDIVVSSATALASPQEIDVRLFLRQGPVLAVTPQVLAASLAAGEQTDDARRIIIANVGRGQLAWRAESDVDWLRPSQNAGQIDAFSSTELNIDVDAGNLVAREEAYVGQITVYADNGEASPQTVTVFLNVNSPARFCNIPDGGQEYIVNSRNAKIRFTDVQRTLTEDGGCDFRATLRASLPQNAALQTDVIGHVDANNVFVPASSSPLVLNVAILTLQLTENFEISNDFGIKAAGGRWKLPGNFGGKTSDFNGTIQIDANGISLSGAGSFDVPDIDYGAMQLRRLKGEVSVTADLSYIVAMTGDLNIGIAGSNTSIKDIELRIDQRGFRSGKIGTFTIAGIAGVDLEVTSALFDADRIRAERAILKIPALWGGAEGAIYGLQIDFGGNVKVSGGRFRLPSISAGGDSFKLSSMEGEFRSVAGGYEIQALGEFGMRGIGESGGCTLIVGITIFSDNGASVLMISSLDGQQLASATTGPADAHATDGPDAVEGIGLRELTLGLWDCQPGLPIGPTGFELTGVRGTIRLHAGLEEVSLKVQIQSIAKLGTIPFVSVEPQATLRPDPFFLGYEGPTYLINMKVSETVGKFENRRFSAEVVFDFIVLHGGVGVHAGVDRNGNFELGGNGWADVSVKKGSVFRKCALRLCVNIPPVTLTLLEVEAEINLEYIMGEITVWGHGAAFKFSFETGDIDFSLTAQQRVVTSAEISQLRAAQQSATGILPDAQTQVAFAGNRSVSLTMPLTTSIPQAATAEISSAQFADAVQGDVLFVLVQSAEGQLTFVLIDPDGHEYSPDNLPEHIEYSYAMVDGAQQMVYSVAQAEPGDWQTKIEGDIEGTEFAVFEAVSVPPGLLDNLALAPTGTPHEIDVQWEYLAVEPPAAIRVYANAYEITKTVAYTNAHDVLVTDLADQFTGVLVAEISDAPFDGRLQSALIDLSQLPSGNYAFWLQAEGLDGRSRRCYVRQGGGCGDFYGDVVRFQVDHSSSFPTTWNPGLAATVNIGEGVLQATWVASSHPDVDSYVVTVRGENVVRSGQATLVAVTVPAATNDAGEATASVSNIEPGETYRITVKAVDEEAALSVQSPEVVLTTLSPDFELIGPEINALVQAGGNPLLTAIDLEMSSNLPYDPLLFVDYDRLPDGMFVTIAQEAVAARPTARVNIILSATADLPPGHYVIPLVAQSGKLERMLNLGVEVIPLQYGATLPLVVNDKAPGQVPDSIPPQQTINLPFVLR